MTVPKAEYDALVEHLADTQASLSAALARIEALRLKQKVLAQEIAKLRLQGTQPSQGNSALGGQQDSPATSSINQQEQEPQQNDKGPPLPCYITEMEGHLPVLLVQGGRKVPGSVVVTEDFIDFVDIKARIKRTEFVGFSSAISSTRRPSTPSGTWKQLIPCLAPTEAPPSPDAQYAYQQQQQRPFSGGQLRGSSSSNPGSPVADSSWPRSYDWRNSWGPGQAGSPMSPPAVVAAAEGPSRGSAAVLLGPGSGLGAEADGSSSSSRLGAWQVLWQTAGLQQHLVFEATQETRELLHKHTEKWLGASPSMGQEGDGLSSSPGGQSEDQDIEVVEPRHLMPGTTLPKLSEPSALLRQHHLALLAEALPGRFKGRPWSLLYGMSRHGISLQTLYRRAAGVAPSVLLVQDSGGAVFGCFASDSWKVGPRFYGTGETFVFQLQPHAIKYPWKTKSKSKNDFFMYSTGECMAVGGLGHFAIWLDSELLRGSSGRCGTFGSSCLASSEDFSIAALELWGLGL